jgi:hypothetical protein
VSGDAGPLRPAFAKDYPADQALDALVDAFSRGDFRRIREEAPKLAAASENAAVKSAALDLRQRIEPSPIALYLIVLALVLLAVLYGHALTHAAH